MLERLRKETYESSTVVTKLSRRTLSLTVNEHRDRLLSVDGKITGQRDQRADTTFLRTRSSTLDGDISLDGPSFRFEVVDVQSAEFESSESTESRQRRSARRDDRTENCEARITTLVSFENGMERLDEPVPPRPGPGASESVFQVSGSTSRSIECSWAKRPFAGQPA